MKKFNWQQRYHENLTFPSGSYRPFAVSAAGLCEVYGLDGTGQQAERRILQELKELPEAIEHVSPSDMGIMLDDQGVFLFGHILMGYISQDKVIEIWKWLRDVNKARREHYALQKGIEGMSRKELHEVTRQLSTVENAEVRNLLKGTIRRARKKTLFGILSR